jgi:hypothetical protein
LNAMQGQPEPSQQQSPPAAFDPFGCAPIGWLERKSPFGLALMVAAVLLAGIVTASAIEGTLGAVSDFQPVADIRRAFSPSSAPPSAPRFPLLRDLPTGLLVLGVAATCGIILKQWQLMKSALPELVKNRVVRARDEPAYRPIHRRLRLEQVIRNGGSGSALRRLTTGLNKPMGGVGSKAQLVIAAVAAGLAALLVVGENRGVFTILTPQALHGAERAAWLQATYNSW